MLVWHGWDGHLPDGDEAGQLGAIYLWWTSLPEKGMLQTFTDAFTGPGDYPPAFALLYAVLYVPVRAAGALFGGEAAPFPAGLGLLLTLTASLTLGATALLTQSLARVMGGPGPLLSSTGLGLLSVGMLATAPLSAALSRQAMPEALLTLWVTLALWLALTSHGFTKGRHCLALGLVLALAGLTKQTMVLYLGLPLLLLGGLAVRRFGRRALLGLLLVGGLALPLPGWWLQLHWAEQLEYGTRSAEAKSVVPLWAELAYYPASLVGEGLGLLWTPFFLVALGVLLKRRVWLPLSLLGLVLLSLTAVPKKYPRLLVPMMPLTAAVLALGVGSLERRQVRQGLLLGGLSLGSLQHLSLSFPLPVPDKLGVWSPELYRLLDPDCPQEWIRRAQRESLAFEELLGQYQRLETRLGTQVLFVREPVLPCSYETTFGYAFHFSDFMRRRGLELDDVAVGEVNPEDFERLLGRARLVVSTRPWCDGQANTLDEPGCTRRAEFVDAGTLEARLGEPGGTAERLRFTLYVYRRVVPVERVP